MTAPSPLRRIPILVESDTGVATMEVRRVAARMGFPASEQTAIATSAAELSNNILRHAGGQGELLVHTLESDEGRGQGIVLESLDRGPGIEDPEGALLGGHSTAGGLGWGLAGVRNLMDELEIATAPGGGARVLARKWLDPANEPRQPWELARVPIGSLDDLLWLRPRLLAILSDLGVAKTEAAAAVADLSESLRQRGEEMDWGFHLRLYLDPDHKRLCADIGDPRSSPATPWHWPVEPDQALREAGWLLRRRADLRRHSQDELLQRLACQHDRLRDRERNLRRLAHYDELTGLANRALFLRQLEQAGARAARLNSSLALLFLDLDGFKQVNDRFGHTQGDALLTQVAARLRQLVRNGDLVARLGGDEFCVLCQGDTEPAALAMLAGRILAGLRPPYRIQGRESYCTASIGIALYPNDAKDTSALLRHADAAMYQAKQAGHDRYQFFDPALDARTGARLELEQALRSAVRDQAFELHYQPITDVAGRPYAVEALLRWPGHQEGPEEFVPVLESTGLIIPLGRWVLDRAASQCAQWRRDLAPGLRVSVNLSPPQIEATGFLRCVEDVLAHSGLAAEGLILEVTERLLLRDRPATREALRGLRRHGIALAIDDFGTGYASLGYLLRQRFDLVKIDRAFVVGAVREPATACIVEGIIHIAHGLGLELIAEGIEGGRERDLMARLGCGLLQGYHYARPMDTAAMSAWLQARAGIDPALEPQP